MEEIIRECSYCKSNKVRKKWKKQRNPKNAVHGMQKTFAEILIRFSKEVKYKVILMYLNNVGIRKIALILGASSGAVSKWIRNALN